MPGTKIIRGVYKSGTANTAGMWHSFWAASGMPGAGAIPPNSPGVIYTQGNGGVLFPDVAFLFRNKFLRGVRIVSNRDCTLMIYDRLCAVGGIALNTTGFKTVNTQTLPRHTGTDSEAVEVWLEITTAISGTIQLSLASYTNQEGVAGRTGPTLTLSAGPLNTAIQLPLQSGDRGVRSVEGLNVSVGGIAGMCNVVLMRPLVLVGSIGNFIVQPLTLDGFDVESIYDGATISFLALANNVLAITIWGTIHVLY